MADLSIGVTAELSEFRKRMADMPDIGAQEARDMVRGIQRELKKAEKSAGDTSQNIGTSLKAGFQKGIQAAAALSAGMLAAGAGFAKLANEVHGTVDSVNTMAQGSGLALDTVNGLRLAAKNANKEVGDLFPQQLILRMQNASNGMARATRAFDNIGVSALDANGDLRSTDDVLRDVMDALFEIEDPTERAAKATELLGKNGKELLSAFNDTAGLDRFVELGQRFGIQVGPDAVAQSAAWFEATADLAFVWENFQAKIVNFGDAATDVMDKFNLGFLYMTELASGGLEQLGTEFGQIWEVMRGDRNMFQFFRESEAGWDRVFAEAREDAKVFFEFQKRESKKTTEAFQEDQEEQTRSHKAGLEARKLQTIISIDELIELDKQKSDEDIDTFLKLQEADKRTNDAIFESGLLVFKAQMERERELDAKRKESTQIAIQAAADFATSAIDIGKTISDAQLQRFEDQAAGGDELSKVEKAQAIAAFKRSQGFAVATAVIQSFITASGITANLAPTMGPFAIAAGIAAAGSFLTGTLLGIANTPQPEFPQGLAPDHQMVGIQPDEGIANQAAMSIPGFRDALRTANNGISPFGMTMGGGSVHVSLDPRLRRLVFSTDERVGKRSPRRR